MLDKARTILNQITSAPPDTDVKALGQQWKALHGSLKKAQCDQMRLARAIAERNIETVRSLIEIAAKAPPPVPRGSYYTPSAPGEPPPVRPAPPMINVRAEKPTAQQLKTALAAFKKRLKLTKLDQESRVGRSPLSAGQSSNIVAILPPSLYPKNYWEELEKQGQIKNTGGGFYEVVEKAKPIKGDVPAPDTGAPEPDAVRADEPATAE